MGEKTLREAARLMRERADAARGERWGWRHFGDDPESACRVVWYPPRDLDEDWCVIADDIWEESNAEHIASWPPAVALAVADWLDACALVEEAAPNRTKANALTVARAYLGDAPDS